MANKIKHILLTAAIFMAACVFGAGNDFICADRECTLLCVDTRSAETNSIALNTKDDFAGWFYGDRYFINDEYVIVKPGYECSWFTLAADSKTARDDILDNCTVSLKSGSYVVSAADISTLAKKSSDGDYLACAKLTPAKYTVTLSPEGGSVSPSSVQVTFDDKYAKDADSWPKAMRTGYDFAGWYTAKDGGDEILWNTPVSTPSNQTLYAHWTAHKLTVTLNPGDNASVSPKSIDVIYGSSYSNLPTPIRPGHDFTTWSLSEGGGSPVSTDTVVTTDADHTLWAQWIARKYLITLDPGEGKISSLEPNPREVIYGANFGFLPTPEWSGYGFSGWYTRKEGEANLIENGTPFLFTSNITIYARYTAKKFTLVYQPQGGDLGGQVQKDITFGQPYGILPVPTRSGYEFQGWWTQSDGGVQVTAETVVTSDATTQYIYAKWGALPYSVTFDFRGGTGGTATTNAYFGKTVPDVVAPQKDGYSFAGYYDNQDYQGLSYYDGNGKGIRDWDKTKDAVLFAKWGEKTYTVTFDQCGGFGGTESQQVTYNGSMNNIAVPKRAGYEFAGYYAEVDGGGAQYFNDGGVSLKSWDIADDRTLYAKWDPISYTVMFLPNGGSGTMESQLFTYGEAAALSSNSFVNAGLNFVKWKRNNTTFYTDGQIVSNLTTEADGHVTLTAQWSETRYVEFLPGPGTGEMEVEVYEGDEAKPLTSNAFARAGYTFCHWTNHIGTVFTDGQYITNSLYVAVAQTNTLDAVWSNNVYTISFDGNGATNSMESVSAVYDVPQKLYNGFIHPDQGAKFIGWGRSADTLEYPLDSGRDFATVINLASESGAEVTLYARWVLDYGPFSEALDCDNLMFESTTWHVITNPAVAQSGDSYVVDDSGSGPNPLYAKGLTGSGTLSFWVKTTDEQDQLLVYVDDELKASVWGEDYYPDWEADEWFFVSMRLEGMTPQRQLRFEHSFGFAFPCGIDCLSWIPDSENPEPTEDDAPVINGAATVEGGRFRVTFSADKRFKYELIKNETLAPSDWKSFDPQFFLSPDADGNISFEPAVETSKPRMFYRVRVLRKD